VLDPAQNVIAAARYLRDLKAKLPERIHEPDRTWLALAAFITALGSPAAAQSKKKKVKKKVKKRKKSSIRQKKKGEK